MPRYRRIHPRSQTPTRPVHPAITPSGSAMPSTPLPSVALQRTLGNQALQQLGNGPTGLLQRDPQAAQTPGRRPVDLFNQAALAQSVREQMVREEAPVRRWLEQNLNRVRFLALADLVQTVRREAPAIQTMPISQLQSAIQSWVNERGLRLPRVSLLAPLVAPAPAQDPSKLSAALSRVLDIPTEVKVEETNGMAQITLSGATVELRQGQLRGGGTINWDGTLGVYTAFDKLGFSASLSADEWKVGVSYALGSPLPDFAKLTEIFQKGEQGLRGLFAATRDFGSLDDIPALKQTISNQMKPVSAVVKALGQLLKAEQDRVHVGVSAEAHGPGPGANGTPGFQLMATLTILF